MTSIAPPYLTGPPLPPPGLVNLGRTCCFNVLLQALAATRTFSTLYAPSSGGPLTYQGAPNKRSADKGGPLNLNEALTCGGPADAVNPQDT